MNVILKDLTPKQADWFQRWLLEFGISGFFNWLELRQESEKPRLYYLCNTDGDYYVVFNSLILEE